MCIKEVTEVCRLCLKNENLVCVFDKRFETTENMRDVIFITTGVEIDEKDLVSKKICKKCLQIVIKIYQFRGSSIKNDTLLKNKYEELTKSAHPSTSGQTSIKKIQAHLFHPSVRHIMSKNPNLVLPQACFYLNMSPYVAMPMNYVETYFKKRNINMQRHIFYALQAIRSDRKPTEIKVKKENKAYSKHSEDECKEEKQYINIVSVDHNNQIKIRTVEKVPDSKKRDNQSDVEKTFSSRESTPDVLNYHKKNRKRLISDSSSDSEKQENTKPSTSEVSGKKWKCDSGEPVQMSFVARTLEICDICNSVQYSMKELKRHKLKHLRCQFCKDKFKTMECKEEHIRQDCVVRKTMNSLPTINLSKIDLNKAVRKKYPNAFLGFAPLLGLEGSINTSSTDNINEKDSMTSTKNVKASDSGTITEHGTVENPITNQDDIIEILSDDDAEPSTVKTTETLNQYSKPSIVESNTPTVSSTNENLLSRPMHPSTSTGAFHQQPLVLNADLPVISSSIVKPDIRIKNNIVLETIDPKASDLMVLKELLKNYKKIQLTKESATQPELPSNTSIIRNLDDFTTTLKDLNHQLRIYRIPVEVKHGVYKVSYDYSPKQKKTRKKADWNHLTPVELKVNKQKKSDTKNNVTNNVNYPNITLTDLLSASSSYPVPNTISISNSTSLNTTSVVTTQTLSNYSIPQEVPVTAPPPYTGVHLTSTSQSINTIPNQTPTMSYHSNNALLAQIVYQPNTQSTVLINQPNNYVTYNPNNSVYNSSAPVMIPNSVPQVLVAASPVFATNPVFNSNSVESLPVLPSTSSSGISSFSDTSSSYSNKNTPNLISNQATSSSLFTPPSSSNSLNNSGPIFPVENVSGINTGSNNALTTGMPSTTSSMPLIRVKDLGSLK